MPASSLDAPETYERLDPSLLRERIAGLPEQLAEAWAAGSALDLPASHRDTDAALVLGMGGSGIGGLLLQALAQELRGAKPVIAVRGYSVPAWAGPRTLVLALSNSGNTEETVAAMEQALAAGARCVAMTTGGRLLELARAHRSPALVFGWDAEPRSALGWSFAAPLAICARVGLLPDAGADLDAALGELRTLRDEAGTAAPEASNPAKQLARRLQGRLGAFVGAQALAPIAYRWRTQINENAKSWAIADELPEMNHNAQEGFGLPAEAVRLLRVVLLRHASMHPRIRLRVDATRDAMRRAGVEAEVLEIAGGSLLAQMLRAAMLGDFVSYYLGLLNGVDPSPVPALEELKALLATRE